MGYIFKKGKVTMKIFSQIMLNKVLKICHKKMISTYVKQQMRSLREAFYEYDFQQNFYCDMLACKHFLCWVLSPVFQQVFLSLRHLSLASIRYGVSKLKLVSTIFYQIFFSPNDSPSKTVKNVFISFKNPFSFSRY